MSTTVKKSTRSRANPAQWGTEFKNPLFNILFYGIPKIGEADRNTVTELIRDCIEAIRSNDYEGFKELIDTLVEITQTDSITVREVSLVDSDEDELKKWKAFIAQRIKGCRESAGMTQEELAKKSGIGQAYISKLENGEHSPSFKTRKKIADALKVDVREFDPISE